MSRADDLFRELEAVDQAAWLAAKLADLDEVDRHAVYARAEAIAESYYALPEGA